jgi:acetyl-CoA decarbonylase/synthase complex subunit beta
MELPVDVGVIYEGERISREEAFVELGGEEKGVELLRVAPTEDVKDGAVKLTGVDFSEMEEGKAYPFGLLVKITGDKLEEDVEGVLERRIHEFINYIQGVMHQNSRDKVMVRVGKHAVEKGLTLKHIGAALIQLLKKEYKAIKKAEVEIFTQREEVDKLLAQAKEVYRRRDEKAAKLKDEEVDVFYGCAMCQNHAANHVCIIAPSRISGCGVISWLEARAAAKIGEGAIFEVPKDSVLDETKGEFEGVNRAVADKSRGATTRVYLHSLFDHPHTQCSCAQAIVFYIPEVDGFGVVDSGFKGKTPFGMGFSTLIKQVGNGVQHSGFIGVGLAYLRSPKFLQGDGGWERVVWMPSHLKSSLRDVIPPEIYDRIATEEEAGDLEALTKFLRAKGYSLPSGEVEELVATAEPEEAQPAQKQQVVYALPRRRVKLSFINTDIRFKKLIITEEKEKNN